MQVAVKDLTSQQPEFRQTIEKAESTAQALDSAMTRAEAVTANLKSSLDDFSRAGEVWKETADSVTVTMEAIQDVRKPRQPQGESASGSGPPRRRFDIKDYTESAEAISSAAVELNTMLVEIRTLLTTESDQIAVRSLAQEVLTDSQAQARTLVDHIAWRLAQVSGLVLVLALVYRFISSRLRPRRGSSSS